MYDIIKQPVEPTKHVYLLLTLSFFSNPITNPAVAVDQEIQVAYLGIHKHTRQVFLLYVKNYPENLSKDLFHDFVGQLRPAHSDAAICWNAGNGSHRSRNTDPGPLIAQFERIRNFPDLDRLVSR
ncbi:hypothetical protein RRG08_024468 [Elysia crispata]|uniref:Uncharacterized protein n=1 Tax=Elysia crispata TaxID=231223 RepID=A0AAE1D302_9GAST|nr:hypothetical protein RRG08_024468 [Elysia crispata]